MNKFICTVCGSSFEKNFSSFIYPNKHFACDSCFTKYRDHLYGKMVFRRLDSDTIAVLSNEQLHRVKAFFNLPQPEYAPGKMEIKDIPIEVKVIEPPLCKKQYYGLDCTCNKCR